MTGPYSSFFELRDNPFRANPDPHYLFVTQQTQKSLEQLMNGIRERKGLMLLTGEVGTGKTVLLNRLREWLRQEQMPTAFIFNSHLKASDLLDLVLADFGIPLLALRGSPLTRLNSWLEDRFRAGQTPVLLVDEAQGLPRRALEELRMLLNLQTTEGNLIQIVLCGQPEFEESLKRLEFRHIHQRIALRCRTLPLTRDETQSYIECRRRVAGASGNPIFQPDALDALFLYSRGIPRVLNLLCEQALMRASGEKARPVPVRLVGEAAREFQFDSVRPLGPQSISHEDALLDLITSKPILGEIPDPSVAPASLASEIEFNDNFEGMHELGSQQFVVPAPQNVPEAAPPGLSGAIAREHFSGAPRSSDAAVACPLPDDRKSLHKSTHEEAFGSYGLSSESRISAQQLRAELNLAASVAARHPGERAPSSNREFDLREYWRRYRLFAGRIAGFAFDAAESRGRIYFARLQSGIQFCRRALGRHWSFLRTKYWNVQFSIAREGFVWSCLQWLRAPTHKRKVGSKASESLWADSVSSSSAYIRASRIARRRAQPQVNPLHRSSDFERVAHLAALILHWLQQPSRNNARGPTIPRSHHSHRLS